MQKAVSWRSVVCAPLTSQTTVKPLVLQLDLGHLNSDVVSRPLIIEISKHSHPNDKRSDNCYCEWFHQGILQFEFFSTASRDPYHARPDGAAAPHSQMDREASQSVAPVVVPIVHYVGPQIFANELHEPVALAVIECVVEWLR